MDAQAVETTAPTNFLDQADVFWPTWHGCFEDSTSFGSKTPQLPTAMLSSTPMIHSSWFRESSSEDSPDASPVDSGPAFSSPQANVALNTSAEAPSGFKDIASTTDGRVLKRKAQNRAAQRAHRERQRDRMSGLHSKIQKLEERCKQLQARNRMFEVTFQRFFKDGVALLSSRMVDETSALDVLGCDLSEDAEALNLHISSMTSSRRSSGMPKRVTSVGGRSD